MYEKFQGCTVDVQAATVILNNPRANPVLCRHLMYAIMLCMKLVSWTDSLTVTVNFHFHAFNLNKQYITSL